jgi:hypothetical protein
LKASASFSVSATVSSMPDSVCQAGGVDVYCCRTMPVVNGSRQVHDKYVIKCACKVTCHCNAYLRAGRCAICRNCNLCVAGEEPRNVFSPAANYIYKHTSHKPASYSNTLKVSSNAVSQHMLTVQPTSTSSGRATRLPTNRM